MSGVEITGLIEPLNAGSFPVFEDINGLGGWRSVADVTARDAIPANFRKIGMVAVLLSTGVAYQLVGGILNANWQQLTTVVASVSVDNTKPSVAATTLAVAAAGTYRLSAAVNYKNGSSGGTLVVDGKITDFNGAVQTINMFTADLTGTNVNGFLNASANIEIIPQAASNIQFVITNSDPTNNPYWYRIILEKLL